MSTYPFAGFLRNLGVWVVRAAILCLPSCASGGPPPSFPSPLLGKPLPRLSQTIAGGPLEPEALGGRVVVIKFFAKYCKPCEKTLPHAQKLHESHPEVTFIGVSLDERRADLQSTIRRYGLTFPIIHDRSNAVAGRFRVREMPTTFVVGEQGNVRWVAGPEQVEKDLELALDSLL